MKKIAATYLFTPENQLLKNGVLICDPDRTILDIATTGDNMKEQAGMEYYSGILVPGFVNTHCHLELSYLKEMTSPKIRTTCFVLLTEKCGQQELLLQAIL